MKRLIEWIAGLIGVAAAAFAISWTLYMPNKDERGVWLDEASGVIIDLNRWRANLYHQSDVACLYDMSFPAHMGLVKAAEGAWIKRQGGRTLSLAR